VTGKKRPIRILDFEIKRERIRYGRATLTLESWASVQFTPVALVLSAHRRGEVTAEEVARAFIRNQTVEHSPTFNWERVDLTILLPRVTRVIQMPNMKARSPNELIPELEALEEREQQRWQQTRALTNQWSNFVTNSHMGTLVGQVKKMQPNFGKVFEGYTTHFSQVLNTEIAAITSSPDFAVNTAAFDGMRSAILNSELNEVVNGRIAEVLKDVQKGNLQVLAGRFDALATANQFRDAGNVVGVTAGVVEKTDSVEELLEGLQPMFANLEKAIKETKDSAARLLLVALAVALIVMMIEASLARLGIPLKSNVPPTQIEPQAQPKRIKEKKSAQDGKARAKATASKKAKAASSFSGMMNCFSGSMFWPSVWHRS
jgi:hypothetical protein